MASGPNKSGLATLQASAAITYPTVNPRSPDSSNKSYKPYNLYAQPVELVEVVEVPAMSRRLTEDFAPVA